MNHRPDELLAVEVVLLMDVDAVVFVDPEIDGSCNTRAEFLDDDNELGKI